MFNRLYNSLEPIRDHLDRFGIECYHKNNYDGRNREITFVVDDALNDEEFVFYDAITIAMNTNSVYDLVQELREIAYHKWVEDFIWASNQYSHKYAVLLKKFGSSYYRFVLAQIRYEMKLVGFDLRKPNFFEYIRAMRFFGSRNAIRRFMLDVLLMENVKPCLMCKYCRVDRNGVRHCMTVCVETDDDHFKSKNPFVILKTGRFNVTNQCDEVLQAFHNEECTLFKMRRR